MQNVTLVILAVCLTAIIAAGCTTTPPATPHEGTPLAPGAISVTIHPDITHYTVLMSSAPGIGLSPVLTGPVPAGNLTCIWKTDYGSFLSWNAPDYTVQDLGATTSETKVYWTYLDEHAAATRPPVHITLTVIDPATGATLGTAEQTIGWDGNDTAVIG